jgi:DNA-binding LytR/AlgR family response regulator
VNLDRVARLEPADRRSFRITLHDGRQLVMSRRRQRLLDYLGS